MSTIKTMDHAAYKKHVKKLSDSELRFTIKDAQNANKAMPDNPNCGYYQDEVSYCRAELNARQTAANQQVGIAQASFVIQHGDGSALECYSANGLPTRDFVCRAIESGRMFLFLRDVENNVVARIPIVRVKDTVCFAITNQRPPQTALDEFYDWFDV